MYRDPADVPDHICAELGEIQPNCGAYYCALERAATTTTTEEDQS